MDLEFADVKPSILNWLIVTLMALTGIVLLKFLVSRYPIPGVASVVAAA